MGFGYQWNCVVSSLIAVQIVPRQQTRETHDHRAANHTGKKSQNTREQQVYVESYEESRTRHGRQLSVAEKEESPNQPKEIDPIQKIQSEFDGGEWYPWRMNRIVMTLLTSMNCLLSNL